jgi:hypothetical protein
MEFDPFGLSVKDYRTKAEISRFNSSGDLYTLHGAATSDPPTSMTAPVDLWHNHLGHPHTATLSSLLSEFSISCNRDSHNSSLCPSCQLGKHVRLPFSSSSTVSTFPLSCCIAIYGHHHMLVSPVLSTILLFLMILPILYGPFLCATNLMSTPFS